MLRFSRLAALLLPALLLFAATSSAYATLPPTLWDYAREAELIVYADVRSVQPLPEEDESTGSDAIARLIVLDAWKGEDPGIVDVPHFLRTGCSGPAEVHREPVCRRLPRAERGDVDHPDA